MKMVHDAMDYNLCVIDVVEDDAIVPMMRSSKGGFSTFCLTWHGCIDNSFPEIHLFQTQCFGNSILLYMFKQMKN